MNKIILPSFKNIIKEIFKDELIFAFICGGVAKNRANKNSDIDIFICVKNKEKRNMRSEFLKFYKQLHKVNCLKCDNLFPGEIMGLDNLDRKIKLVKKVKPTLTIKNKKIYDGIVWAGMLSGNHINFIGDKKEFLKRKHIANKIIDKWKKELLIILSKMKKDIMLKKIIKFSND